MKILNTSNNYIYSYNNSNKQAICHKKNNVPIFKSTKNLTIRKVLSDKKDLLPLSILNMVESNKNLNQDILLSDLHKIVYDKLKNTKTLEEAKELYPELISAKEATDLIGIKSKIIDIIKKKSSLENFTLEYLKKLYLPTPLTDIVKEYGFSNTSMLNWLNEKLNIQKLKGNYLILLKYCDEEKNAQVTEHLTKICMADQEVVKKRIEASIKTHKTKKYRNAQRKRINHHKSHPEISENVKLIDKRTWELCPDVKRKMHNFAVEIPKYAEILRKQELNKKLTENEKKALKTFRKMFWEQNPECKLELSKARTQAYQEFKSEQNNNNM